MKSRLILFIDINNRILSPAAETIFRTMMESEGKGDDTIVSAGTTNEGLASHDKGMVSFLTKEGLPVSGVVNPLSMNLVEYADYIVCMDDESLNCRQLKEKAGALERVLVFPTKDALSGIMSMKPLDYERIFEEVTIGCRSLLDKLMA